ncbi:MAG: MerR family transcriptional regulator [Oscillospiraceae bacterium]
MTYSIKQVSEQTGLRPHVLRFYEKEGLLPGVGRTHSGIRTYSQEDIDWLGLVCCLKNTGMSLKQIREFVDLSLQGGETLAERCEMLELHRAAILCQLEQMQLHLKKVDEKIDHFSAQQAEYERSHAM